MDATLNSPVHTFHIPVMGTGFTIDTPLKVAHYGISSAISLVDDILIEQMRKRVCLENGVDFDPIPAGETDFRARRITAYLNLLDTLVRRHVERVRGSVFQTGSEIVRYFDLLPPSPVRDLYERMQATTNPAARLRLQERLRQYVRPGTIDVNIMTKLDRECDRSGKKMPERCSDALSALRGFMNSSIDGSLVLSAGMNRRLFSYMSEFRDLFPAQDQGLHKRIVLKVSDYRSAFLQGKLLAKLGLYVSEFRVESGLNCGGHAFGGKGQLLGPVLAEFKREKQNLVQKLFNIRSQALKALGRDDPLGQPVPPRITVQGGIGDPEEDRLLREYYDVDGTGWGSAFLFVPEAVNIDHTSLQALIDADESEIHLSEASPLGVPFWSLRSSASEETRRQRIAEGKPGSACPKGYLVSSSEFTTTPLCTASRAYQRRKLEELSHSPMTAIEKRRSQESIVAKACICHDLAGCVTGPAAIDPQATAAVCCGPNAAYFKQSTSLKGMIDFIYGRAKLALDGSRPHMLLKELSLHIDRLRIDLDHQLDQPTDRMAKTIGECRDNLQQGIEQYRALAGRIGADRRQSFIAGLERLQQELSDLSIKRKIQR